MEDKKELSEVYKELRKFTGVQDLKQLAAEDGKAKIEEVKNLIKQIIQEGKEDFLVFRLNESQKLFAAQEITQEQFNTDYVAYIEFTNNILSKTKGLDRLCVLRAILPTKKPPTYEKATDKAIKEAEKILKSICKATGCKAETIGFFAVQLVKDIAFLTRYVYFPEEHKSFIKTLVQFNKQLEEIEKKITKPYEDKKNDVFYKERDQIINEINKYMTGSYQDIYQYEKADRIAADIVSRLYPEQVIDQSIIRTERDNKLYFALPSTSTTKIMKQILNNPTRVRTTKRGQIKNKMLLTGDSTITYKGNDSTVTLTLERTKELFTKKIQNGAKVFNFFLQKLNEQHRQEITTFQLSELVENGAYANKDSAYRGLKSILSKIYAISIEGVATEYNGRKKQEKAFAKSRIVSTFDVTYNSCHVSLTPIIRENMPYITLLPNWSYKLNENSYMLLDYISILARQNAQQIKDKGFFNISLEAIRAHMGLPTPEEAGSDPKRLIYEPIEKAITEIEETQKDTEIKLTPSYYDEYENINTYLAGYLRIDLDQPTQAYMTDRAIAQEKEYREEQKRIEKAKQKAVEKEITQA